MSTTKLKVSRFTNQARYPLLVELNMKISDLIPFLHALTKNRICLVFNVLSSASVPCDKWQHYVFDQISDIQL